MGGLAARTRHRPVHERPEVKLARGAAARATLALCNHLVGGVEHLCKRRQESTKLISTATEMHELWYVNPSTAICTQ
jgi:hypothetical protein